MPRYHILALISVMLLSTPLVAQTPRLRPNPLPQPEPAREGTPNSVPEALDAALKLLERFDRSAKPMTLDVTLAEVTIAKPDAKMPDLTGPDVLRKLDALVTDGHKVVRRTYSVAALDGKPATAEDAASKPYVTSETTIARGASQRNIQYRDVGTTIKLLARHSADGVILVELGLIDSGVQTGDVADAPPTFAVLKVATTVSVPSGKVAVAYSKQGQTGTTRSVILVIVGARSIDTAGLATAR